MATTAIKKPSFSMITISLLQIVLLCTFCHFGHAQSNYTGTRQTSCPWDFSVNLSNATRNDSGYYTEWGDFFPTYATRIVDGVRRGCICDLEPCLAFCPPEGADTGLRPVTDDDYVNYGAIPKVHTTNRTIDYEADSLYPEQWFHIFVWDPCPAVHAWYYLSPAKHPVNEYYLLADGSLFLPRANKTRAESPDFGVYCLDLHSDYLNYTPKVCFPGKGFDPYEVVNTIHYIGGLVAVPFIIATVIVYSILPELRNIHGTALRCYLCCLAVTNVAFAADRAPGPDFDAGPWCLFLGFFIYFSFTAGILWLNVVCIDLWWRLGGFGSLRSSDNLQRDRRKFFWCSVYVWGISIFMTAICIGMEFHPDIPESLIRPGFRRRACWFNTRAALVVYYLVPTGLIILCNICLFISTSMKLCQHAKISEHNFETGDSRRHNHNEQWYGLHLKLFLIMGICWSTDTISGVWESPNYWIVTDMMNALQGLLIFLIFVCKKNIWHSLNELYGHKMPGADYCCHFGCRRTSGNPLAPQEFGISNNEPESKSSDINKSSASTEDETLH